MEEIRRAVKSMVEGKSCGDDNIPVEVIKRCGLEDILLTFCNDALFNNNKPTEWSVINIVPIPKVVI